jgi:hypothetical protein
MNCRHEYPEDPPAEWDLTPFLDAIYRDADVIDARAYGRHRMGMQQRGARRKGEMGAQVFALVSGIPRSGAYGPDGGADFPGGVNVKTVSRPDGGWYKTPFLCVNLEQLNDLDLVTERYAVAEVEVETKVGRLWVVVSSGRAREGFLIMPNEHDRRLDYRRLDAKKERADMARGEGRGVCMVCGRGRGQAGLGF